MEGVFELPEAQRDRFAFKLDVELPDRAEEATILERFDEDPTLGPDRAEAVVSREELTSAREAVEDVYVADRVKEYVLDLVAATRDHPDVEHGVSPRGSLTLLNGSKARALVRGRKYATPDDVKQLAHQTLVHRLVMTTDAELGEVSRSSVVDDVLSSVATPDTTVEAPETVTGGE